LARKILLADDSVTAQNMGRKILADAGYEVITVNNGSAALKKIGEQRPDLIVLDVYMPGYSGLEVCQRLKEVPDTARIPVLLTVGKLEPFKPEEAKRVRAEGFIVKPFEASELLSALSKLEDKIVPRAETSKPGRLARATAAIEEARQTPSDEDSGWKNRISFPSKTKVTPVQIETEDAAIYNPVNKDLRTTVEHHRPNIAAPADTEERVDLGALAPEGLPKDVTPEEIAALAAAAAQVQGKILESKATERAQDSNTTLESKLEEAPPKETASAAGPVPEVPEAVTFAEQSSDRASGVEAIARHELKAESESTQGHAGNGSWTYSSGPSTEEPVTIAAAAAVGSSSSPSRWTAVAVALAPEDSGLSLEQEMQQAYAAFATDQNDHSTSTFVSSSSEVSPSPAASNETAPEASLSIPAIAAPEAAQSLASVATAASEAVSAAVKQFETVSAAHIPETASVPPESSSVADAPAPPETAIANENLVQNSPAAAFEQTPQVGTPPVSEQATAENPPTEEVRAEATEQHESVPAKSNSTGQSEVEVPRQETQPAVEAAAQSESEPEQKETEAAATTAAAWASWRRIRESGDANHTGSPASHEEKTVSTTDAAAAMAVAAGAETTPEEVASDDSDPAIASIVDSVLADLRPKIVEEISRKLGKKK
jgi:twitching motility two-component system response regulator PilH